MENKLKQKLQAGQSAFGIFQVTSGLDTALILSEAGLDLVIIDGEHGSMSIETAGQMVSIYKGSDTSVLVRVVGNDVFAIKQALDTGAHGVMIPMVNHAEQARQAVAACKYPPTGVRGMGPGRAVLFGSGGGDADYYAQANEETLVMVQIEHYEAVQNIEEILQVPGIDIAFLGPFDLSASMGIAGQTAHPEVQAACRKVADACKKHGVIAGIFTSPAQLKTYQEMGYTLLMGGLDSALLYQGAKELMDQFKKE